MNKILLGVLSTAAAVMLSGCTTPALTQAEIDDKVDQFTQEHHGLKIGDSSTENDGTRVFALPKNFLDFTGGGVEVYKGKVVRLHLAADISKEIGKEAANAKMRDELSQLAVIMGLDSEYFSRHRNFTYDQRDCYLPEWYRDDGKMCASYTIHLLAFDLAEARIGKDNFWRYIIEIRTPDWRRHAR